MTDTIGRHMELVARHLLGDPNKALSSKTEWRYGERGSLKINLEEGLWHDFESDEKGGVFKLITRERGIAPKDIPAWLNSELGIQINGASGQLIATYPYTDEAGAVLYEVLRYDPKNFLQRRPNGVAGEYTWGLGDVRRVLFRLPKLLASPAGETVFICEGEKDVLTLEGWGLLATTNSGGAGYWRDEFAEFFEESDVVIVPHNDDAGRARTRRLQRSLADAASSIRVVNLPGLPDKGDVTWWRQNGGTKDQFLMLCAGAEGLSAPQTNGEMHGDERPIAPYYEPPIPPFSVLDASDYEGKPVPERQWLIPNVLVRRSVTLFAGDGGTGKSLMCLQMQVAAALGREWLGLTMPEPINSFGYYCEDDEDEIHRRLYDVCQHERCTFADLQGRVRFISRVGQANELVAFDGFRDQARATRTPLFSQIEAEVRENKAQLIIIDTVADAFAGNEIVRPQVRAFVNMIRNLALIHNGGVILNAHPSKSGMADGSGFSGSTAWNGSVRNRLYLTRPKGDEDDEPTEDRLLKVMKSNYGPFGDEIRCKWQRGVFVRTDRGPVKTIIDQLTDEARVLKAIEYLINHDNRLTLADTTKAALTNQVRHIPSCKDLSWKACCVIRDRLMEQGKLVKIEIGPPSKRVILLRPPHMLYPGEKNP